jgi:hypothetical protein
MLSELDKEYRKVFFNQKRWAKHWTTNSAHRNHSSTQGMTKPAQKAIEYIESIEKLIIPEKDRLMLLFEYYENNGTLIFGNSNNGLKKQIKILEMDGVAHIYKMPKG